MTLSATLLDPAATQRQLRDMTAVLVDEFDDHLSPGTVLRCVARCRSALLHSGARGDLVARVETLARLRLESRTETHLLPRPSPRPI